MKTTPMVLAGGELSKIIPIIRMPTESPSPITRWAHPATMKKFLRSRGMTVLRYDWHYFRPTRTCSAFAR